MRKTCLVLASALFALAAPTPAAETKSEFLGRWLIAEAHPAPWSVPGDPATAPFDAHLVGKAIIYDRRRIRGPRLLACHGPHYRTVAVPPEGLFQGGLTAPAAQAAALGFRGAQIATLQTGCPGSIDFHFIDRATALFALDNMVYTIRRQPRAGSGSAR